MGSRLVVQGAPLDWLHDQRQQALRQVFDILAGALSFAVVVLIGTCNTQGDPAFMRYAATLVSAVALLPIVAVACNRSRSSHLFERTAFCILCVAAALWHVAPLLASDSARRSYVQIFRNSVLNPIPLVLGLSMKTCISYAAWCAFCDVSASLMHGAHKTDMNSIELFLCAVPINVIYLVLTRQWHVSLRSLYDAQQRLRTEQDSLESTKVQLKGEIDTSNSLRAQLRLEKLTSERLSASCEELADSMIAKTCDSWFWLGSDGHTVLRCDASFDRIIGCKAQGKQLRSFLQEGDRQRLMQELLVDRALVRLLSTSLLRQAGTGTSSRLSSARLLVVDRCTAGRRANGIEPHYLVGVQLLSRTHPPCDEAGLGGANAGADSHATAEVMERAECPVESWTALQTEEQLLRASLIADAGTPAEKADFPDMSEAHMLKDNGSPALQAHWLPTASLAWVQGGDEPQPIHTIRPGDSVLMLKVTEDKPAVVFSKVQGTIAGDHHSCAHRWVRVELDDGTEAVLEANQPVFPQDRREVGACWPLNAIAAKDLTPGMDSLWVMGPRLVRVIQVYQLGSSQVPTCQLLVESNSSLQGAPGTGAALSLLSASSASGGSKGLSSTFVATACLPSEFEVPSSRFDALVRARGWQQVGGSFLHLKSARAEQDSTSGVSSRETKSEPAGYVCPPHEGSAGVYEVCDAPDDGHVPTRSRSATSSTCSNGSGDTEVLVGGLDWDHRQWTRGPTGEWEQRSISADIKDAVSLSDTMALPCKSFGSLLHRLSGGPCKVCVFANKPGQHCRYGLLCHFCHEPHSPYKRKNRRRATRGSSSETASFPDTASSFSDGEYL